MKERRPKIVGKVQKMEKEMAEKRSRNGAKRLKG